MFTKIIFLAFAIIGSINAQISYLDTPVIAWTGVASPVDVGNGVYMSPDGALAVVVSRDATVVAFNSIDGTIVWSVLAPTATAQSFGGAFFCASQYIIYSYVDSGVRYGHIFFLPYFF